MSSQLTLLLLFLSCLTTFSLSNDFSSTNRCRCLSACDTSPSPYQCSCEHNTAGTQCETCQPLYNQLPWMQSLSNENPSSCEACNCMEHANSCVYNPLTESQSLHSAGNISGGGVCQSCEHNTMGYSCEECIANTYRDLALHPTDNDTCKLCDCYLLLTTKWTAL